MGDEAIDRRCDVVDYFSHRLNVLRESPPRGACVTKRLATGGTGAERTPNSDDKKTMDGAAYPADHCPAGACSRSKKNQRWPSRSSARYLRPGGPSSIPERIVAPAATARSKCESRSST
jgi:hypothetical protein